jgi:trehalose synthase
LLGRYEEVAGRDVVRHLRQLAEPLRGIRVVHVNSTRSGGGVAEILHRLVPMSRELGIETDWEVIEGEEEFYQCTKRMHNGLQGAGQDIPERLLRIYEETNRRNAERLRATLEEADAVFIHDPQPAPLLRMCPDRRGRWVWRCHIDLSRPRRPIWKYLRPYVEEYDASIWSLAEFAQNLRHPLYLIPPSIDPLSEKNVELPRAELDEVRERYQLDPERPVVAQISRFDRFKDPVGVIQAYRLARKFSPLQLVLAGGTATDDPEGQEVLAEVEDAAADDPDVHLLLLPPDAHRTINALQRIADIVVQKSLREGFGLTVSEALWKSTPVIGGDAGGIRLQVVDNHTGFLVSSPEGAALRIRYLLMREDERRAMGEKAREFVRDNFLLTRQLREYLTLMLATLKGIEERIELG